ncbi:MAG: sugar ABC transporter permease [Candidatus Pristimantibacillus lignocellulolyticus]|uniref:Sugar ABC transporter permease n=1 Tax=Candidatus Pristimantibacillus lignocellulolyticus TaxID=2994561 RepID=A0A9J6ZGF6_9BACL|nr:MAG: sugar ABC transporter permease [Candidatus Pristimantibacillus lignocellulolyticus]
MGQKQKNILRLFFSYLILIIIAICCIYPALWVVFSSFRPGSSLFSVDFIPKVWTLDHYRSLFSDSTFTYAVWYWNTLKIATITMIFSTLLSTISMYALSRFRFKGRQNLLSMILVLGMFPGFMSLIPLYILLMQFELLNTHLALIIVYSFGSVLMNGFVIKGFFDTVPRSLDESARIDGATHLQVFTNIMIPLGKPILIYVALTTFTGAWVDFIFARLVLTSRDKWTLAVGMYDLVNSYQNSNFTMFAAGAVLIAVPITLLFIFLQKFLVQGLTAGASKG